MSSNTTLKSPEREYWLDRLKPIGLDILIAQTGVSSGWREYQDARELPMPSPQHFKRFMEFTLEADSAEILRTGIKKGHAGHILGNLQLFQSTVRQSTDPTDDGAELMVYRINRDLSHLRTLYRWRFPTHSIPATAIELLRDPCAHFTEDNEALMHSTLTSASDLLHCGSVRMTACCATARADAASNIVFESIMPLNFFYTTEERAMIEIAGNEAAIKIHNETDFPERVSRLRPWISGELLKSREACDVADL